MHDAAGMKLRDAIGQLADNFRRAPRVARLTAEQLFQRSALDEFRRGQRAAGVIDDRKHRDERGMEDADDTRVEVPHINEQDGLRCLLIASLDAGRRRFKWDESVRNHRT